MITLANCDLGVIVAKGVVLRSIVRSRNLTELSHRACRDIPSERSLLYVFTFIARLIRARMLRFLPKMTAVANRDPPRAWI